MLYSNISHMDILIVDIVLHDVFEQEVLSEAYRVNGN